MVLLVKKQAEAKDFGIVTVQVNSRTWEKILRITIRLKMNSFDSFESNMRLNLHDNIFR